MDDKHTKAITDLSALNVALMEFPSDDDSNYWFESERHPHTKPLKAAIVRRMELLLGRFKRHLDTDDQE